MKKITKTIMIISDDWDEDIWIAIKSTIDAGIYFYNEEDNKYKFNTILYKSFNEFNNRNTRLPDVVLIDYGLISGEKDVEIIEGLIYNGIPVGWIGGLGDLGYYNEDAKKSYSNHKVIHNLPSASTGTEEILILLYQEFFGDKK